MRNLKGVIKGSRRILCSGYSQSHGNFLVRDTPPVALGVLLGDCHLCIQCDLGPIVASGPGSRLLWADDDSWPRSSPS